MFCDRCRCFLRFHSTRLPSSPTRQRGIPELAWPLALRVGLPLGALILHRLQSCCPRSPDPALPFRRWRLPTSASLDTACNNSRGRCGLPGDGGVSIVYVANALRTSPRKGPSANPALACQATPSTCRRHQGGFAGPQPPSRDLVA
jgi:hypothetical protein